MARYVCLLFLVPLLVVYGGRGTATAPVVHAANTIQGDVTCEGAVNALDSLQILRSAAGLSTSAGCLADAGDVNCDGAVNAVDALGILRYASGLSNNAPDGCTAIGEAPGAPPTSEELIAAALDAGEITYEESLLYRAYALYDDPRLPEEFRSPMIDYHAGRLLLVEIEDKEPQLSHELLDELAPFRARPNDPISIFNNPSAPVGAVAPLAGGVWESATSATGEVRVWIRTDWNSDADLSRYTQAATKVWTKLDTVFGLPTPDQVGNPPNSVNPDNAIDIYFLPFNAVDPRMSNCLAHPNDPDCKLGTANGDTAPWGPRNGNKSSGYSKIQNTFSGDELLRVIAHELAHVVQNKYDWNEDKWLSDSTADWVAFRVLQELAPTDKSILYQRAKMIFDDPDQPLSRDVSWSRYGAWLYFFFASMDHGDAIVKSVWQEAAAEGVDGIKAADRAIPFATNFDDFTLRNWNKKPPLKKEYKEKDTTFPAYEPKTNPWFFGWDDERTESDSIAGLGSVYYRYTFNSPIRKITVDNLVKGNPDAHVWALIKIGADWKEPEDWTSRSQKVFCRDLPDDNVTDLVIIVSNSNLTNPIAGNKLKVKAETEGCHGWVGTASGSSFYQCCENVAGYANGSQILETHTTANIIWVEDPTFFYGCNCTAFFPTGTIDWSVYYHVETDYDSCTSSDSGTVAAGVGLPDKTAQIMIRWDDPHDPSKYIYTGNGGMFVDGELSCDGGFTYPAHDFFYLTAEIDLPEPTPTPTPSPAPTPGPTPFAGAYASAASPMCDQVRVELPRDATSFSGRCYLSYTSEQTYEVLQWSFTRVDVIAP